MARVSKGDSLRSTVLQPGWVIEKDGFGLLTASATYVTHHGNSTGTAVGTGAQVVAKAPTRGAVFEQDGRLKCHQATSTLNANGLQVVSANFIGIAEGVMTEPEVRGQSSTVTEPITQHPGFPTAIGGTPANPLFGAEFETTNGGGYSFKGFTNPIYSKYGLKSYLAPTFVITGHFYTSDMGIAKKMRDLQCTPSSSGTWDGIKLLGGIQSLQGATLGNSVDKWQAGDESPQLLLTGVSFEFFGHLCKVSYEITVATDGWDIDVYPYTRPKETRS